MPMQEFFCVLMRVWAWFFLLEIRLALGVLTYEEFDEWVDPTKIALAHVWEDAFNMQLHVLVKIVFVSDIAFIWFLIIDLQSGSYDVVHQHHFHIVMRVVLYLDIII